MATHDPEDKRTDAEFLLKDYEEVGDMTLDAVRTIRTATLPVYGHNSQFIRSYEFLHEALPNCRSVLLPGGDHFGPLEQPELLTKHVLAFPQDSGPHRYAPLGPRLATFVVCSSASEMSIGLSFRERMSGYFLEDTADCRLGARRGRARGNRLALRARIHIPDLAGFLRDPHHTARLEGELHYGDLGKALSCRNGFFQLFVYDPARNMRRMIYRFHFHSASGQPYYFFGEKEIYCERSPLELVRGMTTLYARIHLGSPEGTVAAAGILRFRAAGLPELLGSMKVRDAANARERIDALARFAKFTAAELHEAYGAGRVAAQQL